MMTSRKWKALVVDTIFSIAVLLATWYLDKTLAEHVIQILGLLQVPVISYILGTAWEDASEKKAGNFDVNKFQ